MSDSDWPPEGTLVRIVATQQEGTMLYGLATKLDPIRWVELDNKAFWPVVRHEIEVIDDEQ